MTTSFHFSTSSGHRSGTSGSRGRLKGAEDFLGAPARVLAAMSSNALVGNYRAIHEQLPEQALLPMIKADAYGHGMEWAARILMSQPNLHGFGVATLFEGAELRRVMGGRGRRLKVFVFSDACPWTQEKGEYCERFGLTPVLQSDQDWHLFLKQKWDERLNYELHFNTGMNRLGMSPNLAPGIAKVLRNRPASSHPSGISSHLAIAESPDARLTREQVQKFLWIKSQLLSVVPTAQFHLGNSAGIWNHKHYKLAEATDVIRPGLALYGVPPWQGAPVRGLEPVMTVKASVLGLHTLKQGDAIGYGATYKVTGTKPVHAAIIGAGYADGIARLLSNQGHAWVSGRPSRFIGIVSMDLAAISCPAETEVGDWVEILGPHVDAWAQARAASTIPYELLTSVSARVQRIYD